MNKTSPSTLSLTSSLTTPSTRHTPRWVLLTVALLPVAALALGEAFGWRFLRAPAEDLLTQRLERTVRLDDPFRLHLLGGVSVQAGRLWIAAPPGFETPHLVDSRNLRLDLRYRDLWNLNQHHVLRIAGLSAGALDAQLIQRDPLGATWQLTKRNAGTAQPLPSVDGLDVTQGRLVLRDAIVGADLLATFSTQEGAAQATPISRIEVSGTFRERPIRGELTTQGLIPVASQGATSPPLPAKGWLEYGGLRVDFDGQVADLYGRRAVRGDVSVKGPSLAVLGRLFDIPLPTTGRFSLAGTVDRDGELWRVDVAHARVGKSDLNGRFVYDPRPMRPLLSGELKGRRFVLADLAPAFGTRGEDGQKLTPPPGRTLPGRPLDLDSLGKMDARIAVDLDHVDLGNAFSLPIAPLKADLTLKDRQLALNDAFARTAKGSLMGAVSLDARQDPPRWRSDLAWDGIRLEDWLKQAKTEGKERETQPYVTGTLHGRAKLTGTGHSTAQLLGSLDGEASATVRKGQVSHLLVEVLGLDVAQGLGLYLKGDDSQPVTCARLDLSARQGVLTPRSAWVDTPVTLLRTEGTVDLAKETLDLRLVAKPRNFSPLTLRSPIRVHGPFADPHATPEPAPIAARLLGGAALYGVNPLAAILPFLDPGARTDTPC